MSSTSAHPFAGFGANEWLVDEMYQQYLKDPSSVDKAWWDFFADYSPADPATATQANGKAPVANGTNGNGTPTGAPSTPAPARQRASAPAAAARTTLPCRHRQQRRHPHLPAASAPRRPLRHAAVPVVADEIVPLKGAAARTVANMEASLTCRPRPASATIPAKLLIDNRIVINNHLTRGRGGKVSFTHIIGYAIVKALRRMPEMNVGFDRDRRQAGRHQARRTSTSGSRSTCQKDDGTRQLLVPSIKARRDAGLRPVLGGLRGHRPASPRQQAHGRRLRRHHDQPHQPGHASAPCHSVPRLMQGQGAIIGVGAMEYPAEYQGASEETLAHIAVSKVMTLTSTYDHRVIQGAQSGDFLRRIHALLLGEDGFYDEIFRALRIPYEPIRWAHDISSTPRRRDQQAGPGPRADPRLPRARPHDGRHRPARVRAAQPPRPRRRHPRPDAVGPRPRVRDRSFGGASAS